MAWIPPCLLAFIPATCNTHMLTGTQTNCSLTKPSYCRQGRGKLRRCSGCCCCSCLWCFSLCLAALSSLPFCRAVSILHINMTEDLMRLMPDDGVHMYVCVRLWEQLLKLNKYVFVCVYVSLRARVSLSADVLKNYIITQQVRAGN